MTDYPRCRRTSWTDADRWANTIAERVRAADRLPQTIVALTRGGWVPARLLADRLGIKRLVSLRSEPVHLTPTEYDLLEALVTNPGKLLTHAWLLKRVWGPRYGDESHYLRVYVRQLRRKLGDDAASPAFILTEPGVGYRWLPDPER